MTATDHDRDILARTVLGRGSRRVTGRPNRSSMDDPQPCERRQCEVMMGGGLCRCLPEAVPVQLPEQERPELPIPERREADPVPGKCPILPMALPTITSPAAHRGELSCQ